MREGVEKKLEAWIQNSEYLKAKQRESGEDGESRVT
jgi:hypothetical protein